LFNRLVLIEDRKPVIVDAVCVDKDHADGHPCRARRLGPLAAVVFKCVLRIDAEVVFARPFDGGVGGGIGEEVEIVEARIRGSVK
jgi:hypothetical protein